MSTDKVEIANLVRILLRSTCVYTASNISNRTDKATYIKAMYRCIDLCAREVNGNDLNRMKSSLSKLKYTLKDTLMPRFEFFANTEKAYMLAIEQSIQVVASISTRFDEGYSSDDSVFLNNIGLNA